MNLRSALDDFVRTFQRSLKNEGKLNIAALAESVNTDIPLHVDLRTYFEYLHFEDSPQLGGRFNLFLFSLDELEGAQNGWRWDTLRSGEIVEDTTYWKSSWVVIADKDGDAIFVDADNGKVFGSIQKCNFLVAQTLADFFDALTCTMKIEMDGYHFDVLADDMSPLPQFLNDVRTAVSMKLDAEATSGFMKFFFG